jgi:hypothetical protein
VIIEYRTTVYSARILRTYKDVTNVQEGNGVTYLYGRTKEIFVDLTSKGEKMGDYSFHHSEPFLIVAINLAPGEYLEVVDVPRD